MNPQITTLYKGREVLQKDPIGPDFGRELSKAIESWLKTSPKPQGLFQNPDGTRQAEQSKVVEGVVQSADVVQLLDYYPYGGSRLNEKTGSFDEIKKFTGYERDDSTGLDYAGARYYNPAVGKFNSQDPAFWDFSQLQIQLADPQSWNSYAYARNNPLKYNDPDGRFWDTVLDVGFTALDGARYVKNFADATAGAITSGIGLATNNERLVSLGDTQLSQGVQGMKGAGGDLAWDAAGTAIPFVPVAGVKVIKNGDNIISGLKLTPNQIGKQGEQRLGEIVGSGKQHDYFKTDAGNRFVDLRTDTAIHEAKNTRISATEGVKLQATKDSLIQSQKGLQPVWHLFKGGTDNAVGFLKGLGVKVIDYTRRK